MPDVLEKINIMSCMTIAMFDIDGYRIDKAVQVTIDSLADFSSYQRQCARNFGKENFLVIGEVVADPTLAAAYIGRGKQPNQYNTNLTAAQLTSNTSDPDDYIRDFGKTALDGAAFNYDIYGAMTRFLGMDGPWGTNGVDWVGQWDKLVADNDMVNSETGEYDPRHMFGMTGQDVFRWPALVNGTQRWLLGSMIVQLELPGIPMIFFGEEQNSYILENQAKDYVFGRMPMASQRAWQINGCYGLGETNYINVDFANAEKGCSDDSVSLDHRDPSHPLRNVIKRMWELRRQFPVLNDGWNLTALSSRTYDIYLPGSNGHPSPHGIWSVYRGRTEGIQDFEGTGQGNQGAWFIYHNENHTVKYTFDCTSSSNSSALVAPFPAGTTVKSAFYPYDEYDLETSTFSYGLEGSTDPNGCLASFELEPYGWKVFLPKSKFLDPAPTITRLIPGHDERINSTVPLGQQQTLPIEIRFSSQMSCDSVTNNLVVDSTTQDGITAQLDKNSIKCSDIDADPPSHPGEMASAWSFKANLEQVSHGVHTVTLNNVTTSDNQLFTDARDRFMFRIGSSNNPMVFPATSNYTRDLLFKDASTGDLYISPTAAGADKFQYSTNWGSSFSQWYNYTGDNFTINPLPWNGTDAQKWEGEHVELHYWSAMTGSSDHVQHADLDRQDKPPRRFPHVFLEGLYNQYGYDAGLPNKMEQDKDGLWTYNLVTELPTKISVNVWGMNPDGQPDKSAAYGDVNGDYILDWVPPDSLSDNVINITQRPPNGYLGYKILVNDGSFRFHYLPVGSSGVQAFLAVLCAFLPLMTAILAVWAYLKAFYQVKFNEIGVQAKTGMLDLIRPKGADRQGLRSAVASMFHEPKVGAVVPASPGALAVETGSPNRRSVLIATMEYDIEDWQIKIKIGGLGVMAQLMGKNLGHQDLIWVVPCVGGIEYPVDYGIFKPLYQFLFYIC